MSGIEKALAIVGISLTAMVGFVGCSAGASGNVPSNNRDKGGTTEPEADCTCDPGDKVGCTCSDGASGVRICLTNCTGFSRCRCSASGSDIDPSDEDWGFDDDSEDNGGTDSDNDGPEITQTTDVSPCGSVPLSGTCQDSKTVKTCVVSTGDAQATVVTTTCNAIERCEVVDGVALCKQDPNKCEPGQTKCVSSSTKGECSANGEWATSPCAGCKTDPTGVKCPDEVQGASHTGILKYEALAPNASMTDWATKPTVHPAPGVLVVSYKYDAAKDMYYAHDATTTDNMGKYTIKLPTPVVSDDIIIYWALHAKGSDMASYAVAAPPVGDGQWKVTSSFDADVLDFWKWHASATGLGEQGSTIVISIEQYSAAMRLFDNLRQTYDATSQVMGSDGKRVVLWMRFNTTFDCGACMWASPKKVGPNSFAIQVFMPGDSTDQGYWSDAVTQHELGHWVMSSWGVSPGEGGYHMLTCATFPGQAWSEGWATWYSSMVRSSSVYYAKQQGTFFWFDIGSRTYPYNALWTRPQADHSDGLMQLIDENEVASMLWKLGSSTSPGIDQDINKKMLRAVKSKRMTSSPFGRGYTTRKWDAVPGTCQKKNVVTNSAWSAPMFADFLDALVCAKDVAPAAVDAVTEPKKFYPYPSDSPICK